MDPVTVVGLAASVKQLAAFVVTLFCNLYSYYEAVRRPEAFKRTSSRIMYYGRPAKLVNYRSLSRPAPRMP